MRTSPLAHLALTLALSACGTNDKQSQPPGESGTGGSAGFGGGSGAGGAAATAGAAGAPAGMGGGSGAGGSGGSGPTCATGEALCNGVCLSAASPSTPGCTLVVPRDFMLGGVNDMALDSGELFFTRGSGVYRVDPTTGAISTLTELDAGGTHELEVKGDTIYFLGQTNADSFVRSMPRTGGVSTVLTDQFTHVFNTVPYFRIGGGYVVSQAGNVLASATLTGEPFVAANSELLSFDGFDVDDDGTVFISGNWDFAAGLYASPLPFPFADAPRYVAPVAPRTLHIEGGYVYFVYDNAYQRIATAGGAPETLASLGTIAVNTAAVAVTASEAIYKTSTGVEVVATGGAPKALATLGGTFAYNMRKLLVDSRYGYASDLGAIVRFDR